MDSINRLILVGNGFDLSHGLRTSYKDFLDWYMVEAFKKYTNSNHYEDSLVEIRNKYSAYTYTDKRIPNSAEKVIEVITSIRDREFKYKSNFFKRLIDFSQNNWVDIEHFYFRMLKTHFSGTSTLPGDKRKKVSELNQEFDFIISELSRCKYRLN